MSTEVRDIDSSTVPVRQEEFFVALETRRNQPIGTLARCASAFNAKALIAVGSPLFSTHGAHGAHRRIPTVHCFYWTELQERLMALRPGIQFIGVAASAASPDLPFSSVPADSFLFTQTTCFLLPDPKTFQFSEEQKALCSAFVHVRMPSIEHEPHLHWNTKVALVLQEFVVQHRYSSQGHQDTKFTVQVNQLSEDELQVLHGRNKQADSQEHEVEDQPDLCDLFS